MRKRLINILFFCVLLSISWQGMTQDVEFSQYYANKVYLNPAFAGSDYDSRIAVGYRNQWPEINSAFETYSAAYDKFVDVIGGGVGLHVLQDKQGDGSINTTAISGIYSYLLPVSREVTMHAGFQGSLIQRKLSYQNITSPDMIDQFFINGSVAPLSDMDQSFNLSRNYFDFSMGILTSYKRWFIGVAAHHLTQPNESFVEESNYSRLPRKYTLHCGVNIPVYLRGLHRVEYSLAPSFLYQQQHGFRQLNYGLYLERRSVVFGTWYRNNLELDYDAIILQVGISKGVWQLAYSYDKTVSKLIHVNTGAHELSLLFRFVNQNDRYGKCKESTMRRRRRIKALKCPRF